MTDYERLTSAVADALRTTMKSLRAAHPEDFYYVTLTIFEGFGWPHFSAMSWEALERLCAKDRNPKKARGIYKWNYADSPYCDFGVENFDPVYGLLETMPDPHGASSNDETFAEQDRRMKAYESAIAKVDAEGLFGVGEQREKIAVLLEVMPPDYTNTPIAKRLNPPAAIASWLKEAAEE